MPARSADDEMLEGRDLAYEVDRFDRVLLKSERDRIDLELLTGSTPKIAKPAWGSAVRETFARLLNGDRLPQRTAVPDGEAPLPTWATDYHADLSECPEWQDVIGAVDYDAVASAQAANTIAWSLADDYADSADDTRAEEEIVDLMPDCDAKRRLVASVAERQEAMAEAREARQRTGRAAARRRKLRQVCGQVASSIEEQNAPASGLLGGQGSPAAVARLRAEIAKLPDRDRLARIVEMVGRLRMSASALEGSTLGRGVAETVGVTLGQQLDAMLPQELGLLGAGGLTSALAFSRMVDRAALVYDRRDEVAEKADRGPVILLVDESSSMRGKPSELAAAIRLYVAQRCVEEGRSFGSVRFSTHASDGLVYLSTGAKPTPQSLMSDALTFSGGGTDIGKAIRHASYRLQEDAFERADVILVTDAHDSEMSSRTVERGAALDLMEARLFLVTCGPSAARSSWVHEAAASVTHIDNVGHGDGSIDITAVAGAIGGAMKGETR